MKIIPSLIAKNQREFESRFDKVRFSPEFHLDVMDGKFVKNKSLWFELELEKGKKYGVHLMVDYPLEWLRDNIGMVDNVIFHLTSKDCVDDVINFLKKKGKKVGIAINPEISVGQLVPYLKKIDFILLMSVNPGKYGARFLNKSIDRLKELRKITKKPIWIDGAMNDKTIKKVKRYVNRVVVGSYLQNAGDVRGAYLSLSKIN